MPQCLLLGVLKSLMALSWGRAPGVTALLALVSTAFQSQQEGSEWGCGVIVTTHRLALAHLFSFHVAFFFFKCAVAPTRGIFLWKYREIWKYVFLEVFSVLLQPFHLWCLGSFSPWPGVKHAHHLQLQIPVLYQDRVQRSPLPGKLVWPPSLALFPSPAALTVPVLLATLRDTVNTHFPHSSSRLESPWYSGHIAEVPTDPCGTMPH